MHSLQNTPSSHSFCYNCYKFSPREFNCSKLNETVKYYLVTGVCFIFEKFRQWNIFLGGKRGYALQLAVLPLASELFKYLSIMSRPQSSLTTGIVAGTLKWNGESQSWPSKPPQDASCLLASLIAALVAQCTDAASNNGGSPDAADKPNIRLTKIFNV